MKTKTTKSKVSKEEIEITTNKAEYQRLKELKEATDKEFYTYRKVYFKEHNIETGTIIKEIVALCKKGLTNKEIADKGYNRGTVNRFVKLYKKGKRVESTLVKQYLPKKK